MEETLNWTASLDLWRRAAGSESEWRQPPGPSRSSGLRQGELGRLARGLGGDLFMCVKEQGAEAGRGGLNGGGCHSWSLSEKVLDDPLFHKEMSSPSPQTPEQEEHLSPSALNVRRGESCNIQGTLQLVPFSLHSGILQHTQPDLLLPPIPS